MIKKVIFLSLLFAQNVLACKVTLPHQLIVFNQDSSGRDTFQSSHCDQKTLDGLLEMLTGLDGRIASFQLKEMMNNKGFDVEITPQSIFIQQFRSLIREHIILPSGVQVKAARSQHAAGILPLMGGDKIELNCSSCLFGTQQPINITIHGFDGERRSILATADFVRMVKAYRLTSPLPSFSSLDDLSILKEVYVESIPHTDLVTQSATLKFYKTNKPLKAGDILKSADLNAINLVKAGLKTDVVLENQMIRIRTSGISRSNGTIGELVEVFHPQKNRKYQGKVIDINKVLVEL